MNQLHNTSSFLFYVTANCTVRNQRMSGTIKQWDSEKRIYIDIYQYTSLCLSIINVLANGFALYIFRQMKTTLGRMSLILSYLSIYEVLFNWSLMINMTISIFTPKGSFQINSVKASLFHIQKAVNLFQIAFQISRNWTLVFLTAYRFENVCCSFSHRGKIFDVKSRIHAIIIAVSVFVFILSLPRVFEMGVELCLATNLMRETQVLLKFPMYQLLYLGLLMFILQSGGPFICIFTLNYLILRKIYQQRSCRKSRLKNLKSSKFGKSSDKLVIFICAVFLIFEFPSFFSKFLSPILKRNNNFRTQMIFVLVANLLIYIDSFLNVFIYTFSNPDFKRVVCRIMRRKSNSTVRDDDMGKSLTTAFNDIKL